jgi:hypothetical protein
MNNHNFSIPNDEDIHNLLENSQKTNPIQNTQETVTQNITSNTIQETKKTV